MSTLFYATVTSVDPVFIVADADPAHPFPAACLYAATVGDRVRVEHRRSGLLSIVQGRV